MSQLTAVASLADAMAWLNERQEGWTLARILEHGVLPSVWLDYAYGADENLWRPRRRISRSTLFRGGHAAPSCVKPIGCSQIGRGVGWVVCS